MNPVRSLTTTYTPLNKQIASKNEARQKQNLETTLCASNIPNEVLEQILDRMHGIGIEEIEAALLNGENEQKEAALRQLVADINDPYLSPETRNRLIQIRDNFFDIDNGKQEFELKKMDRKGLISILHDAWRGDGNYGKEASDRRCAGDKSYPFFTQEVYPMAVSRSLALCQFPQFSSVRQFAGVEFDNIIKTKVVNALPKTDKDSYDKAVDPMSGDIIKQEKAFFEWRYQATSPIRNKKEECRIS